MAEQNELLSRGYLEETLFSGDSGVIKTVHHGFDRGHITEGIAQGRGSGQRAGVFHHLVFGIEVAILSQVTGTYPCFGQVSLCPKSHARIGRAKEKGSAVELRKN